MLKLFNRPFKLPEPEQGRCYFLCRDCISRYCDIPSVSLTAAKMVAGGVYAVPATDSLPGRGTVTVTRVETYGSAPEVTGYWGDEDTIRAITLDPQRTVWETV